MTVWKSDNQGVKEETFIHTSSRVEMGNWAERTCGKEAAGGLGWIRKWLADWVAPHLHVDKLGGTTGE